jgi:hypothetical protein
LLDFSVPPGPSLSVVACRALVWQERRASVREIGDDADLPNDVHNDAGRGEIMGSSIHADALAGEFNTLITQ